MSKVIIRSFLSRRLSTFEDFIWSKHRFLWKNARYILSFFSYLRSSMSVNYDKISSTLFLNSSNYNMSMKSESLENNARIVCVFYESFISKPNFSRIETIELWLKYFLWTKSSKFQSRSFWGFISSISPSYFCSTIYAKF